VLLLAAAARPHAQGRATFVPSLSVGSVHDDNLFSRERPVGDYLTELRPSLEGTYESPQASIEGLLTWDMQMSARHSSLNTLDARRHAMFDSRFRSTPSVILGLAGRYDKSETPGDLNLETGIMLDRQNAQRWQATPSISFRVRPRTMITALYDRTNETLDDVFYADLHVARLGVTRQASARNSFSVNYLGRMFIEGGERHHSQAATIGWTSQITPATSFSVLAGPRVTTYRGTTAEILGALIRKTPRSRLLIDYWHGETIVLGIHGPVGVHSGTTKYSWTLKRNLEIGAHAGLFDSTTIDAGRARVYHFALVGAWSPRPSYVLAASYGADFQRGDIRSQLLSQDRVRRGVFLVRLTVAPRFSRIFRPKDEPEELSAPVKGVPR
jgi:hypothetical protein